MDGCECNLSFIKEVTKSSPDRNYYNNKDEQFIWCTFIKGVTKSSPIGIITTTRMDMMYMKSWDRVSNHCKIIKALQCITNCLMLIMMYHYSQNKLYDLPIRWKNAKISYPLSYVRRMKYDLFNINNWKQWWIALISDICGLLLNYNIPSNHLSSSFFMDQAHKILWV